MMGMMEEDTFAMDNASVDLRKHAEWDDELKSFLRATQDKTLKELKNVRVLIHIPES